MAKLLEYQTEDGGKGLMAYCPGCQMNHSFIIERHTPGPLWTWNGDLERPTFSPSLGVFMGTDQQCHSFVRNGQWQFLNDCRHALRGQTVDLLEVN